MSVLVNAGPASPADAVQVYLDFDPSVLEVVSLTGGPALEEQLQATFDNGLGRVNYAVGTLGESLGRPFTLVTVEFRAIGATGQRGTDIVFSPLVPPRQTKSVIDAGVNNTGTLTPVNLVVQ
jgi:hypothetical protein